jgi:hypothetical protein
LEKIFIMSLNGLQRLVATFDKIKPGLIWTNYLLHWIWATEFHLVGPIDYHSIAWMFLCWRISSTRVFINEA